MHTFSSEWKNKANTSTETPKRRCKTLSSEHGQPNGANPESQGEDLSHVETRILDALVLILNIPQFFYWILISHAKY